MAMHTDDQTADAARESADGTDSPRGIGDASASVTAADGAASGRPLANVLVLEALSERAIVRIAVDGAIDPDFRPGASDVADGDTVICRMDGTCARKRYRFSGTMVDLEVADGDAAVSVDLHREDPAEQRRLSVHAQGAEVEYEFAVSGTVERESGTLSEDRERSASEVATGTVDGSGVDEYLFTGAITGFETSTDEVLVMMNDRVVEPDELG